MEIIEEIDQVPGDKGKLVQQKCSKVMPTNADLVQIRNTAKVLEDKSDADVPGSGYESRCCCMFSACTNYFSRC